MDLSRKRIMADMKNIKKNNELINCGIHVKFNEDNIYNAQAMIIGPKDTPYENGFYFFDINYPCDYPMNPPKVKFCTLDGGLRFNPNLYACGKVCLSIIGTWSGPGWTSCLTLTTILVSIQSLLNENPITNEPGFDKEPLTGETSKTYNSVIAYNNIRVAVLKMLVNPPYLFMDFKPIMIDYFNKNIDFYRKYINENKLNQGQKYSTRIYSMNGKYDINFLDEKIEERFIEYNSSLPDVDSIIIHSSKINKLSKKKKTPNENANDYNIGHVLKSENDNRDYLVKKMCFNKKGANGEIKNIEYNKWVLKK